MEKKKAYLNLLKEHGIQLQLVAFQAIEALLAGPHFEAVGPNYEFFSWISTFLHSEDEIVRRLARYALESFLDSIAYKSNILAITISQCYSPDWDISSAYFLSLVELYTEEKLHCNEVELLLLAIYKMGDRSYAVRRRAQELLITFKSFVKQDDKWQKLCLAVESGVDETNERAQLSLSTRLAKEHVGLVCSLIEEMVLRLEAADERGKRQMLTCLVPWVENLDLKQLPGELLQATIEHLLLMTLKYSTDHAAQIEQIWFTVAKSETNVTLLLNKLLDIGNAKVSRLNLAIEISFLTSDSAKLRFHRLGKHGHNLSWPHLFQVNGGHTRTRALQAVQIRDCAQCSHQEFEQHIEFRRLQISAFK